LAVVHEGYISYQMNMQSQSMLHIHHPNNKVVSPMSSATTSGVDFKTLMCLSCTLVPSSNVIGSIGCTHRVDQAISGTHIFVPNVHTSIRM
jgi:hypothetical protein